MVGEITTRKEGIAVIDYTCSLLCHLIERREFGTVHSHLEEFLPLLVQTAHTQGTLVALAISLSFQRMQEVAAAAKDIHTLDMLKAYFKKLPSNVNLESMFFKENE